MACTAFKLLLTNAVSIFSIAGNLHDWAVCYLSLYISMSKVDNCITGWLINWFIFSYTVLCHHSSLSINSLLYTQRRKANYCSLILVESKYRELQSSWWAEPPSWGPCRLAPLTRLSSLAEPARLMWQKCPIRVYNTKWRANWTLAFPSAKEEPISSDNGALVRCRPLFLGYSTPSCTESTTNGLSTDAQITYQIATFLEDRNPGKIWSRQCLF